MWYRLINVGLGIWLMVAPAILGYGIPAANNDRIIGPLLAAFATVAIWETTRELRRANSLLGVWLIAAPLLLGYEGVAIVNSMTVGAITLMISLQRGKIKKEFGGGWSALWRSQSADMRDQTNDQKIRKVNMTYLKDNANDSEVVVITGASAGVGRATACQFALEGARIGLLARGEERLQAAKQEVEALGGQALVLSVDVADPDQVEAAASLVEETFGPIDIWVNNAMVSVFSPIKETKPEEFKRVTEVTYLGYVYGTLSALKRMLARDQGVIVQVGSALAYRGIPLQAAYCGAKHAIEGFTDSLRVELLHDKSNVKVTTVQMPALNTPQFGWVKSRLPNKAQPVPPIFEPEVAAEAIVWAAHHPRREYILGGSALQAVVLEKFLPDVAARILAKSGYKSQQTDEPRDPNRPHNLWEPVPGDDQGARGAFTRRSLGKSTQWWFAKYRKPVAMGIGGFVAMLTGGLIARKLN